MKNMSRAQVEATLLDSMDGTIKPEMIEAMMRSWAPMGEASMKFWQKLFDNGGRAG